MPSPLIIIAVFSTIFIMTSPIVTNGNVQRTSRQRKAATYHVKNGTARSPQRKLATDTTTTTSSNECPTGCSECSVFNGCIKCKARHFLMTEWQNMRQLGRCTRDCPRGYFRKVWNPKELPNRRHGKCSKCTIENCERCKNKERCARCTDRYLLHRGRCLTSCPPSHPEFDSHERICRKQKYDPECQPSEWTDWSPCLYKNSTLCTGFMIRSRTFLYYRNPLSQILPWGQDSDKMLKGMKEDNWEGYKYRAKRKRRHEDEKKAVKRTMKLLSYEASLMGESIQSKWGGDFVQQRSNEVIQCPDSEIGYKKCFRKSRMCVKKIKNKLD